eukprot:6490743-Amphidinium_carterae.1
MGWALAVDLVQEAHLTLVARAAEIAPSLDASRLMQLNSLFPSRLDPQGRYFQSVYVDNWDQLVIVIRELAGSLSGRPSEGQSALRSAYLDAGVASAPDKAVCGEHRMISLGAAVDGLEGTVGVPMDKRGRLALLLIHTAASLHVHPEHLRTLLGKLIHCLEFRRPLLSILDLAFAFAAQHESSQPLPIRVADELLLCAMLLPMAHANLRASFQPTVTVSDASPEGGGSCFSTGLTAHGRDILHALDVHDHRGLQPILLLSCTDGVGAPRQALLLLDITPIAYINVERNKAARRITRQAWPDVVQLSSMADITEELVRQWRLDYKRASRIFICATVAERVDDSCPSTHGGAPIGLQAIADLLQLLDSLRWPYMGIIECALSVTPAFLQEISAALHVNPLHVEGASVSWLARDSYYFILNGPDSVPPMFAVVGDATSRRPKLTAAPSSVQSFPSASDFLDVGARRATADAGPWPALPASLPLLQEPVNAESHSASLKAVRAWRGDSFRSPAFHYEVDWLISDSHGLRTLSVQERFRLLGFFSGHAEAASKTLLKRDAPDVLRTLASATGLVPVLAAFSATLLNL